MKQFKAEWQKYGINDHHLHRTIDHLITQHNALVDETHKDIDLIFSRLEQLSDEIEEREFEDEALHDMADRTHDEEREGLPECEHTGDLCPRYSKIFGEDATTSLAGTTSLPNVGIEAAYVSTPLFKAEYIDMWILEVDGVEVYDLRFKSEEQAREALLKLTT